MTIEEFQDMYDNLSNGEKLAFALSIKEDVLGSSYIEREHLPLSHYYKEELIASLTEDNVYYIDATKKELTDWLEKQVMD